MEDITFRSTKIRTLANALTVVPNSKLCGEPITNWTRMKMRLAQFTLGLTYGTPKRTVEAVTNRVRAMLENHPAYTARPCRYAFPNSQTAASTLPCSSTPKPPTSWNTAR